MKEDIAGAGKAIDNYEAPINNAAFRGRLNNLLAGAEEKKSSEPRSDATRHWAVVYTELEKISAYLKTYLGV